jgi:hypothetical protein
MSLDYILGCAMCQKGQWPFVQWPEVGKSCNQSSISSTRTSRRTNANQRMHCAIFFCKSATCDASSARTSKTPFRPLQAHSTTRANAHQLSRVHGTLTSRWPEQMRCQRPLLCCFGAGLPGTQASWRSFLQRHVLLRCACMSLEDMQGVIICVAGQGSCVAMASQYPTAYRSITTLCFAVDARPECKLLLQTVSSNMFCL